MGRYKPSLDEEKGIIQNYWLWLLGKVGVFIYSLIVNLPIKVLAYVMAGISIITEKLAEVFAEAIWDRCESIAFSWPTRSAHRKLIKKRKELDELHRRHIQKFEESLSQIPGINETDSGD